jgi:hypothetical protein
VIPKVEAECRQGLFEYYKEACEDFPDLAGTEILPIIDGPDHLDEVFGLTMLVIPTQIEGRSTTFKVLGGCAWSENGVQLFFRDSALEQVRADTASLY